MFPADYWRFFLIATRPESKDTNFTWCAFLDKINADLNDTVGNFIHAQLDSLSEMLPRLWKMTEQFVNVSQQSRAGGISRFDASGFFGFSERLVRLVQIGKCP